MTKPTEEEICHWLSRRVAYDGENLVWIASHKKSLRGQACGRPDRGGYRRINNPRYGMVAIHRLIFFMLHGYLPLVVDHIDGDPTNNKAGNLRAATVSQNAINCKTPVTNTSGRKGVYRHAGGKWQASIRTGGKLKYLGLYEDFNDAINARILAEKKYHGDFARA